jgi:hypothetical protein
VELGDVRFTAWDFGPCESESETVWLLGGAPLTRLVVAGAAAVAAELAQETVAA